MEGRIGSATAPPLRGRQMMRQRWCDLTFLHWRVEPGMLADALPPGVRPDVFDGSAWVGLIPFRMVGASPGRLPPVPWLGTFLETNVRTYGVDDSGRRGVVFCSLESSRLAVAVGARVAFGLPYTWARMGFDRRADGVRYRTSRRWPGPRGTGGRIVVRPGPELSAPGPLDTFLTARWGLHVRWAGRTRWIPNEHPPWSLRRADLLHLDDTLLAAAGFPQLAGRAPDSVLYADGVPVRFGFPR